MLTGQRPETTGLYGNRGNFRSNPGGADRITLGQYLQSLGYESVGAGKIFHGWRGTAPEPNPLSDPASWNQQWVGNVGTTGQELYLNADGWGKWHDGEIRGYLGRDGVWGVCPEPTKETADWLMADFCADFLKKPHDKPFFLACGIRRPHSPQLAPREYFERHPLDKVSVPEVPADDLDDIDPRNRANFTTPFVHKMREKGEWQRAVQAYLACMSFADDCVGHILDALRESAYADNTIVIFLSDHGWQLGHKDRWEKYSNWHQATNAPLIVKTPDPAQKGVVESAVSFLDIFPTVIDLLKEEKPAFLEGHSFAPLLSDPKAAWEHPAVVTYPQGTYSVHYKQWNYIAYKNGSEELYDHSTDPNEFTNLIGDGSHHDQVAWMRKWLPE